jgi:hypothetical protein|nr:hypothetical protein [Kofleriaceae bacterium]
MAALPRVVVVDDDKTHDVLDVVAVDGGVVRARCAYLFEIGEELALRIESGGQVTTAIGRVRAHGADGVTELELADQSEPHKVISG